MSAVVARHFAPLPELPRLDRVVSPALTIVDRAVEAITEDEHRTELTLRFQPYQGVRLTAVDCFQAPDDLPARLPDRIYWSAASPWIDELTATLARVDHSARFMERAVHFLLPAGDDVLEVVAWQVEVRRPNEDLLTLPG